MLWFMIMIGISGEDCPNEAIHALIYMSVVQN
jgi:hypothetical protein